VKKTFRILISTPRGPQGQAPHTFYYSHDQSRRRKANRYTREEAVKVAGWLTRQAATCPYLQGDNAKYRPTYVIV
jgi:hypothetical protein